MKGSRPPEGAQNAIIQSRPLFLLDHTDMRHGPWKRAFCLCTCSLVSHGVFIQHLLYARHCEACKSSIRQTPWVKETETWPRNDATYKVCRVLTGSFVFVGLHS